MERGGGSIKALLLTARRWCVEWIESKRVSNGNVTIIGKVSKAIERLMETNSDESFLGN